MYHSDTLTLVRLCIHSFGNLEDQRNLKIYNEQLILKTPKDTQSSITTYFIPVKIHTSMYIH